MLTSEQQKQQRKKAFDSGKTCIANKTDENLKKFRALKNSVRLSFERIGFGKVDGNILRTALETLEKKEKMEKQQPAVLA